LTKEEISNYLSEFVWSFKVGDNIAYNFKILFLLYKNKEADEEENKLYYNKPIVVFLVSIVEAVLVDLLKRLDVGTNDLPSSLLEENIYNIKTSISKEKKLIKTTSSTTGETYQFYTIKRYDFNQIVKYCRKYNLLFDSSEKIYDHLDEFAKLRNRIHIENYYNNFEQDEHAVFINSRLTLMERILKYVLEIMTKKHSRINLSSITKASNKKAWLIIMS